MELLQTTWLYLTATVLAAFFVAGGFDFGSGITLMLAKDEAKRGFIVRAITPFWDANQVWLVTAGGALFAAFPKAYSAIFSQLYTPLMLLLACLIFRITAIELWRYGKSGRWRNFFEITLCVSSLLTAAIIGLALGAIFTGSVLVKCDGFWESILRLISPVSVCSMIMCVAFFNAQGATFLALNRADDYDTPWYALNAKRAIFLLTLSCVAYIGVFAYTYGGSPKLGAVVLAYPFVSLAMRFARRRKFKAAFLMTSLFAVWMLLAHAFAAGGFIIPPFENLTEGLKISDAASSDTTLKIMLGVALTGVPLAIAYSVYAHIVFAKKS